jgi:PhnB protein
MTMTLPYKPEGYTSVAPYLIVKGAAGTIGFLEKVFNAQRLQCHSGPEGLVMHAEVRIDDTVVMLADSSDWSDMVPSHVHVYVKDVDATFRRAIEAGAKPVQEPVKKEDSDKRGGFQDAGGTTWWVGTKVE